LDTAVLGTIVRKSYLETDYKKHIKQYIYRSFSSKYAYVSSITPVKL